MRERSSNRSSRGGFTLIELLVAVAVVAVLAAVAYPAYTESVRKARRAEARAALLQLMQQQERFYTQRNTYIAFSATSTDPDAKRFRWHSGDTPGTSAYQIRGVACGTEPLTACVRLVAQAGGSHVDPAYKDSACPAFALLSNGQREGNAACWN
ncbi:MAG TPA: type IV pilin protein [Noviherbaspirillum sp.]|nr:type IV pilin protein [Noviherbaspirillum sp.]